MHFLDKYAECIDQKLNKTTQTNVVIEESGRRYCLVNATRSWKITKVKVENCIMKGQGEKGCEAILIGEKEECKSVGYFIELKGVSVGHALEQIEQSLDKTIADLKNMVLFGRIIPSQYKRTKFLESKEQRLIIRFKKLGGNFIIKENLTETI